MSQFVECLVNGLYLEARAGICQDHTDVLMAMEWRHLQIDARFPNPAHIRDPWIADLEWQILIGRANALMKLEYSLLEAKEQRRRQQAEIDRQNREFEFYAGLNEQYRSTTGEHQ